MSFTIKVRGGRAPMIAEYMCPEHGRFDATVERDEHGDPPAAHICGAFNSSSSEMLEARGWPSDKPCAIEAPFVMSAPRGRVKPASVTQGKSQKPERKTWLDTRELGEGMPLEEWQAKRAAIRDEQRRKDLKELMS